MPNDTAASELIGVMALIAIFVTAAAIVGVALLSSPPGDAAPAMIARMANEGGNITLYHDGGDPLESGHFTIFINGVDRTADFNLIDIAGMEHDTWTSWKTGEALVLDDGMFDAESPWIQITGEDVGRTGSDWLLHEIGAVTPTPTVTVTPTPVVHDIQFNSQKTSYFESGGYYQFTVANSGIRLLTLNGNPVSLNPGDSVRLTLGSDTTGTINAGATGIQGFPSSNITVTINGAVVGSGTLSSINVDNIFTRSTITVNIPAVMRYTGFTVDGSTIISGQDERQIRLYNIQPSTEGTLWLQTGSNVANIGPCGAESYQLITPP
ncbi:type IV pilin N-terminal domain-containing protein [Methanoculleus sp.]|uniref:type IV pilin N-terminal domain-containing protein n=1 Tax=Methanoculleus sp. TaxID=90427 RepID=UPI002FCA1E46